MITLFWLLVGLLILIALAIILPPLWRQRTVLAADMDTRNIVIAKTRLAELKDQLQSGALTQAQYEDQRTELELALADDLDITTANATPAQGRWLAYVLAMLLPLSALALYAGLGTYQAITPTPEMLGAAQPATPNVEDINKMVAKLAGRMKTNPTDAEGWTMLGKSYKYLQQFPKAADAFAKAYALLGEQSEIMLLYADALAFANNEQMAGKPAELVFKVLAHEPDNITALWYGGMAKAQTGEAAEGVKLWRKLLTLLPPDSPAQQEVKTLLSKLEAAAPGGVAGGAPTETVTAAQAPPIALEIQVSLAPELQASVTPNDTVFIYAQALTGSRVPLAIIRKQVSDLPLTVTLTDALAMMPNMKLSNFADVKLLARVSKSGNAMSQPGDLIGTVESAATSDKNNHAIVINSQVK
ncbi:MAG: c-type cytochrome biogenesis protein CcmI [Methylovulum sp.]|uniref:c-type cytochrome biogenesis protein CcmI n=1 Tax=Methylovulum sp. TaxID=1916980 RepID=UPI0026129729|nr:c-type cytochrome biogenesis protein CcmI [Methylovulum sp.]MDD2723205.1 c-type cytochrome biogenesis protein CcmI [Methylovulum sp.]MDD5123146.1 c-type cytochrome biogenesis protein CcmI [Methylovulum sp.]